VRIRGIRHKPTSRCNDLTESQPVSAWFKHPWINPSGAPAGARSRCCTSPAHLAIRINFASTADIATYRRRGRSQRDFRSAPSNRLVLARSGSAMERNRSGSAFMPRGSPGSVGGRVEHVIGPCLYAASPWREIGISARHRARTQDIQCWSIRVLCDRSAGAGPVGSKRQYAFWEFGISDYPHGTSPHKCVGRRSPWW